MLGQLGSSTSLLQRGLQVSRNPTGRAVQHTGTLDLTAARKGGSKLGLGRSASQSPRARRRSQPAFLLVCAGSEDASPTHVHDSVAAVRRQAIATAGNSWLRNTGRDDLTDRHDGGRSSASSRPFEESCGDSGALVPPDGLKRPKFSRFGSRTGGQKRVESNNEETPVTRSSDHGDDSDGFEARALRCRTSSEEHAAHGTTQRPESSGIVAQVIGEASSGMLTDSD